MKYYAPVAPIKLLQGLEMAGILGREHLLLAPDVLLHPVEYRRLFKNHGYQIILDTGACEGNAVSHSQLLEAGALVDATIYCLPDVLQDRKATLDKIEQFLKRTPQAEFRWEMWMGIPQGNTIEEVIDCAHGINDLLGEPPQYWGVPRWMANKFESRRAIVRVLANTPFQKLYSERDSLGFHDNIHLLGMSQHLDDDLYCARMDRVMGIDSANPLVLGQLNKDIIYDYDHPEREESKFWESEELTEKSLYNVVKMRSLIG